MFFLLLGAFYALIFLTLTADVIPRYSDFNIEDVFDCRSRRNVIFDRAVSDSPQVKQCTRGASGHNAERPAHKALPR